MALGDIDGDGNLDIVTANTSSDNVSVLLGDGTGGFAPAAGSPVAVGNAPYSVALGDIDGDGDLDIATANAGGNDVSILVGNGTGGFAAAAGSPVAVGSSLPLSVALGDLNGDGDLDIVAADGNNSNVSVLLGNGTGGFAAAAGSPIAVGFAPQSVALGDLDGDGDLDIVTANRGSHNVTVLLGDGTGAFAEAAGSPVATANDPFSVALSDLDGDGDGDIVTANLGNKVSVLLGDGTGGFAAAAGSPFAANGGPTAVALGDLNPVDEVSLTDTLAFTEGEIRKLLPQQMMIVDPDGTATLASATLTIGNGFSGSGDLLAAVTTGSGISASFNAGTGVLSLTGTASIANYTKVLRSVTFASGENPTHGGANASRTVSLTVDDGGAGGTSAAATVTLNITAQNDAPTDIVLSPSSISENSANGAMVGALASIDPDGAITDVFTLLDNAGGRFAINGSNLIVANGALIDFEQATSHSINVRVTDCGRAFRRESAHRHRHQCQRSPCGDRPGHARVHR